MFGNYSFRLSSKFVGAVGAVTIAGVAWVASVDSIDANSHKGGGTPVVFTDFKSVTVNNGPDQVNADFDFGSSKEIVSVSIDADTSVPCTAVIARDLADTPPGSNDSVFVHTFHQPGSVHHNFAVPIPITTNPILVVVLATGGTCTADATITLK